MNPKKYQIILDTSIPLVNKYGFKKLTVEEICNVAKVSKVTFYKYFKNKIHLVEKIIDSIGSDSLHEYQEIVTTSTSSTEFIRRYFELFLKTQNSYSEIFYADYITFVTKGGVFSAEFTKKEAQLELERKKLFQLAKQKGFIRKDISYLVFNKIVNCFNELLADDELKLLYHNNIKALSFNLTQFLFFGILIQSEKD